jgi:hypothetical protein
MEFWRSSDQIKYYYVKFTNICNFKRLKYYLFVLNPTTLLCSSFFLAFFFFYFLTLAWACKFCCKHYIFFWNNICASFDYKSASLFFKELFSPLQTNAMYRSSNVCRSIWYSCFQRWQYTIILWNFDRTKYHTQFIYFLDSDLNLPSFYRYLLCIYVCHCMCVFAVCTYNIVKLSKYLNV